MLYDAEFLKKLDEQHEHTTYVRIQALTFDEQPLDKLEGRVTSGSINLDGKSAIRRSCSLSFIATNEQVNDYYWTFKQKFKVEIGLDNFVDENYPKRIWFNMGTFFITNFSSTKATNSITISIQGKDKMCLLNGELGGVINAETDFGTYDYTDANGVTTNYKLEIKEIVTNLIYTYAQEPLSNIIIQDLEDFGLEQLDYKNDEPMYLIRQANDVNYIFPIFESNNPTIYIEGNTPIKFIDANLVYDSLMGSLFTENLAATKFRFEPNEDAVEFCAAKVTYGEAIGYRNCPLVYAGDLIAKAGDTVTSVLDKIIKMLGEFEYFYDVEGRFILRHKKSFINTIWMPKFTTADGEVFYQDYYYSSPYVYNFSDTRLITNIQNSPQLASIKNDYTVWGERISAAGGKLPIHSRYAIDTKPFIYVSVAPLENTDNKLQIWCTAAPGSSELLLAYRQMEWLKTYCIEHPYGYEFHCQMDWRELIYQMAKEYRRYNQNPNQELGLQDYTTVLAQRNAPFYEFGHTGYEQYYTDMEGFWRQLYWPFDDTDEEELAQVSQFNKLDISNETKLDLNEVYIQGVYRPNVKSLKRYKSTAIDELEFKTTERFVQIANSEYYVVLDINHYYYFDEEHHGFAIPLTDNGELDTTQIYTYETIQPLITVNNYKNIYTPAVDLSSQLWYKYMEETDTIIPWMDQYNYFPGGSIDYGIPEYNIQEFYTQTYNDGEIDYAPITETYKGSKYGLYVLKNTNQDLAHAWQDKTNWWQLITLLYNRNANNYNHWAAYLNNVTTYISRNATLISALETAEQAALSANTPIGNLDSPTTEFDNLITDFITFCTVEDYETQCTANAWTDTLLESEDLENFDTYFRLMQYDANSDLYNVLQETTSIGQLHLLLNIYCALFQIPGYWEFYQTQSLLQYELFINLLPEKQYIASANVNNGINLVLENYNNVFLWDNNTYYSLADVVAHPILARIYKLNNATVTELPTVLTQIQYDLYGLPNPLITNTKPIYYYTRDLLYYNDNAGDRTWWSKQVFEEPYNLNFWFDFLDTQGEISKYSVSEIGDRPIVINDTNLKSIFYREIPKILIINLEKFQDEPLRAGYNYILLPTGYENYFSISARGLSIKNKLDDLVYQHTYCNQTINLTCIPIYYLDVNTRIQLTDGSSNICDDFAVQTISYSLNYNGTMSLNTAKIQPNSIFEREE